MILTKNTRITRLCRDECTEYAEDLLRGYLAQIFGEPTADGQLSPITLSCDTSLAKEEYRLAWDSTSLSVSGGSSRGILYGVIGLLSDVLGCRFYAADTEYVPHLAEFSLGESGERSGKPSFEYRTPLWYCAYNQDWAVKNRTNGNDLDARHGGFVKYNSIAHTFSRLIPEKEYFDGHPEYFMLDENGERKKAQPCLTHPKVFEIMLENARKTLRSNPDINILSVTQNDNVFYCRCPECEAAYEKYGAQSGLMIEFVNKIAEALEGEFPDVLVDTFAYVYTRHAPKGIKPRKNVVVRLCSFECCYSHTFDDCKLNAWGKSDGPAFIDDLRNWSEISDRLYVWNYTATFSNYHTMFPNYYVIGPNFRTLYKNNVRGIFDQGQYQTVSGEFAELRAYVASALMWDITADENALIEDFLRNYYGPGWRNIKKFMDMCAEEAARPTLHLGIYMKPDDIIAPLPGKIAYLRELWDNAEKAAVTQLQRDHVKRSMIQIEYYMSSVGMMTPEENLKLHAKMVHYGINMIREGQRFSDDMDFSRPANTWHHRKDV